MVSAAPSVAALIRAAQTAGQDICSVKGRESEYRSRKIGAFSAIAGIRDLTQQFAASRAGLALTGDPRSPRASSCHVPLPLRSEYWLAQSGVAVA
jgi:hypothetical protein